MRTFIIRYTLPLIITLLFFITGVSTLSDYGLNIDESSHFMRGQGFLRYLLTGKTNYEGLTGRRSAWQDRQFSGNYLLNTYQASHPTANDILAAATNYLFYQKLGILGDLEAYHLFEIFISSLLVLLVGVIATRHYGRFAGIMASLAIALYPLFFGESHFNIKDPVEATFFAYTIYLFYLGIEKKQHRYFIVSGIAFALAWGTKFNALFLPFIFIPYLIIRYFPEIKKKHLNVFKTIPVSTYISLTASAAIAIVIYLYFNPRLWGNPLERFLHEQVAYYLQIGTGSSFDPRYVFFGLNMYAPFFITISTPPYILILFLVGLISSIKRIMKKPGDVTLLILFWLLVPITRVMIPRSSIYSGVRQIMEYLPAMAIIAGIGALSIVSGVTRLALFLAISFRKSRIRLQRLAGNSVKTVLILLFVTVVWRLYILHPNENIYLNFLVGGLKGAVEQRIPGAGETMGNVYLQGIKWLNERNDEVRFGLLVGHLANIPGSKLAKHVTMGPFISGINHRGEYIMEMFSVDFPPKNFSYTLQYFTTFLQPVHEIRVEGVSIFKIWKNEARYLKPEYSEEQNIKVMRVSADVNAGYLILDLDQPARLTKLEADYPLNCPFSINLTSGRVYYSTNKKDIEELPARLWYFHIFYNLSMSEEGSGNTNNTKQLSYWFPAVYTDKILIEMEDLPSCMLTPLRVRLKGLKDTSVIER